VRKMRRSTGWPGAVEFYVGDLVDAAGRAVSELVAGQHPGGCLMRLRAGVARGGGGQAARQCSAPHSQSELETVVPSLPGSRRAGT